MLRYMYALHRSLGIKVSAFQARHNFKNVTQHHWTEIEISAVCTLIPVSSRLKVTKNKSVTVAISLRWRSIEKDWLFVYI